MMINPLCVCMNVMCSQLGRCLKESTSVTPTTNSNTACPAMTLDESAKLAKQAERRELFVKMYFSQIALGRIAPHDTSMAYIGKETDRLILAADEFSKKE